jgi:hypothetical protein
MHENLSICSIWEPRTYKPCAFCLYIGLFSGRRWLIPDFRCGTKDDIPAEPCFRLFARYGRSVFWQCKHGQLKTRLPPCTGATITYMRSSGFFRRIVGDTWKKMWIYDTHGIHGQDNITLFHWEIWARTWTLKVGFNYGKVNFCPLLPLPTNREWKWGKTQGNWFNLQQSEMYLMELASR